MGYSPYFADSMKDHLHFELDHTNEINMPRPLVFFLDIPQIFHWGTSGQAKNQGGLAEA